MWSLIRLQSSQGVTHEAPWRLMPVVVGWRHQCFVMYLWGCCSVAPACPEAVGKRSTLGGSFGLFPTCLASGILSLCCVLPVSCRHSVQPVERGRVLNKMPVTAGIDC